jgi:hypothetical protein
MFTKLFIAFCLVSLALAIPPPASRHHEPEEPANYQFSYEVNEPSTGDIKKQHEEAKNGAISGYYTLNDADGYKRIVHYTADDEHGFQADVKREPLQQEKKW